MPETQPVQPVGASPAPTPPPSAAAPAYPQHKGDPVTRWLIVVIVAIVILVLAAILSALFFGVFNTSGAPRTQVERDLKYYSQALESGKATSQTISFYIDTLIRAGQLSKARDTLDQALKSVKKDKSYVFASQANLSLAEQDYQAAVKNADKAMAEAEKELAAFKQRNVENNRREDAGAAMPDSFTSAALVKASALLALKNVKGAIDAYDAYLKVSPTDADILVLRGQKKAENGDNKGAEKDFRAALKFIPDYQPALEGLQKIGASQ